MDKNQVVLITGASRGIGKELARRFAKAGYSVIANYNTSKNDAQKTVDEIIKNNGTARHIPCDVSVSASVKEMIENIMQKEGRIDALVNNAAIIKNHTIGKMSADEWDDVVNTDLTGSFYVIRACSKIMMKQKQGSIINIASIAGVRGLHGCSNYTAAKGGLISLTKSAAKELGRFNICVNAVLPGFHFTDMGKQSSDRYTDQIKQESVLNTTTDINELAEFVVFLSQIKTVSGQVFNWDSRII